MHVVAIISRKGGAGKTTLSVNLAVASFLAGGPAIVLDMDPQGSARVWAGLRASASPVVVQATEAALGSLLDRARSAGAVLAVIDTPPHVGGPPKAAARAADLAIVPCRPSILDLEAATASFGLAREARVPAVGLVWGAPSGSTLGGQAVGALKRAGIRLLGDVVVQRAAYAHAATVGQGVQEYAPASPAASEMGALHGRLARYFEARSGGRAEQQQAGS